jgi:hypothetical protein
VFEPERALLRDPSSFPCQVTLFYDSFILWGEAVRNGCVHLELCVDIEAVAGEVWVSDAMWVSIRDSSTVGDVIRMLNGESPVRVRLRAK